MTNNKDICDNLIKKIFGSNFYFVHGTFGSDSFKDILKRGKITSASKAPKKYWRWEHDEESKKYVYCISIYDEYVSDTNKCYVGESYSFLIDPRILFYEDVIFNTQWTGRPISEHKPEINYFSIYMNKTDTKKERFDKLIQIKESIDKTMTRHKSLQYCKSHEFLFPKSIDIDKYLIGVIVDNGLAYEEKPHKKAIKILNKKYNRVKIYEKDHDEPFLFPQLMDIVCN